MVADIGGVIVLALLFSTDMPRPLLELGRLELEAKRPADLIAASSSFLLGNCICVGGGACFAGDSLPHVDATDFTDGDPSPAFSLFSSTIRIAGLDFFMEPKPLNSGMLRDGRDSDVLLCEGVATDKTAGLLAGAIGLLS